MNDLRGAVSPLTVPFSDNEQNLTWLLSLLPSADSWYPTGTYSHSFGLEGMVQAGWVHDITSLRDYLSDQVMPSLQYIDIPLLTHSWKLGKWQTNDDWLELRSLCDLGFATKGTRELREASHRIGKQRLDLAAQLYPGSILKDWLNLVEKEKDWFLPASIILGLEGSILWSAPLRSITGLLVISSLSSIISAAMKLIRMGPRASQQLLHEALKWPREDWYYLAENLSLAEIGWSFPWADIASAQHERADSRLFIS